MENVTKEAGGGYFCHDSSPAGCMGCITHYSRNIQRLKSFKKKRKENSLIQKRNFLPPLSLSLSPCDVTNVQCIYNSSENWVHRIGNEKL